MTSTFSLPTRRPSHGGIVRRLARFGSLGAGLVIVGWLTAGEPVGAADRIRRVNPGAAAGSVRSTNPPSVTIPRSVVKLDGGVAPGAPVRAMARGIGGDRRMTNLVGKADGTVDLALAANRQLVVWAGETTNRGELTKGRNEFPGTLLVGAAGEAPKAGKLFLEPRPTPLKWDAGARAFVAHLVVGLDLPEQRDAVRLTPPLVVQFFPAAAQVEPSSVTIETNGTTGYREVRVWCQTHERNPSVVARSDLGELSRSLTRERLGVGALVGNIIPTPFLFAAVVGGGLGGLLRAMHRRRGSKASRWRHAGEGMAVGLITVIAVSVGITLGNLTTLMVGREPGIFVIAALAGYAGVALVERLSQRVFGDAKAAGGESGGGS